MLQGSVLAEDLAKNFIFAPSPSNYRVAAPRHTGRKGPIEVASALLILGHLLAFPAMAMSLPRQILTIDPLRRLDSPTRPSRSVQ